jgi:hypothetical protein
VRFVVFFHSCKCYESSFSRSIRFHDFHFTLTSALSFFPISIISVSSSSSSHSLLLYLFVLSPHDLRPSLTLPHLLLLNVPTVLFSSVSFSCVFLIAV